MTGGHPYSTRMAMHITYDGYCHTCTIWVAICLLDQARFAVFDPATGEALCTDPAALHHYEAKWIKVDRIRSLQIRRRLAPGTSFKRSFECSIPAPRSPMLRMPCGASPRRRGRAEASRCVEKAACGAAGAEPLHMQAFRHNWRLRPVCAAGGSLRMARGAWATMWEPGIQKNA